MNKDKSKNKKKGKKGIGGKIVTGILIALVLFSLVIAAANFTCFSLLCKKAKSYTPIVAEKELSPEFKEGTVILHSDTPIKVLDLSSLNIFCGFLDFKDDLNSLETLGNEISAEKPDLVIISGDSQRESYLDSGTFNNRYGAEAVAKAMESLKVYWAPVFNNKDADFLTVYDSESLAKFYENSHTPYSLYPGRDIKEKDFGTYEIVVVNSSDNVIQVISVLDSHGYVQKELFNEKAKTEADPDNIKNIFEFRLRAQYPEAKIEFYS